MCVPHFLTRFACADAALARLVDVCVGWSCCLLYVCGLFLVCQFVCAVIKPSALAPRAFASEHTLFLVTVLPDCVLPRVSSTHALRVLPHTIALVRVMPVI